MTNNEHELTEHEMTDGERFPLENWYREIGYDELDLNVLHAAYEARRAREAATEHDQ